MTASTTMTRWSVEIDENASEAAAEMRMAASEHGWSAEALKGDLATLACGEASLPTYERPAYFRSVGLGLEDIAMAYGIWKLSQARQG